MFTPTADVNTGNQGASNNLHTKVNFNASVCSPLLVPQRQCKNMPTHYVCSLFTVTSVSTEGLGKQIAGKTGIIKSKNF